MCIDIKDNNFEVVDGVTITDSTGIHECYASRTEKSLMANISKSNIMPFMRNFCEQLKEPLFFILQLPANLDTEEKLRTADSIGFHSDVYYLDGCSKPYISSLLDRFENLLVNDGYIQFGIASHQTKDELFFVKYKVANLYGSDIQQYDALFEKFGIPKETEIKTVCENFSRLTPGEVERMTINGEDAYTMLEDLKKNGLYYAKTVED